MPETYRSILLFGAPGVGKGTQGKLLGQADGFVHIATGDIFRALDPASPEGRKFREYSTQGLLVPDELTIQIWSKHVSALIAAGRFDPQRDVLVLDGMPRSLDQACALDAYATVLRILHLKVADLDEMVRRIINRGLEHGRADDGDEAIVRRRFTEYDAKTKPVLSHYDHALVQEIDPMGSIEDVHERVWGAVADLRQLTPVV